MNSESLGGSSMLEGEEEGVHDQKNILRFISSLIYSSVLSGERDLGIDKQFNELKSDFSTYTNQQNNTQRRNTQMNNVEYQKS